MQSLVISFGELIFLPIMFTIVDYVVILIKIIAEQNAIVVMWMVAGI